MYINYQEKVKELASKVHICETPEELQNLRDRVSRYANATLPNTLNTEIFNIMVRYMINASLIKDELEKNEQLDKIKIGLSTVQYLTSRGLINPNYYILHPAPNNCDESNNYYKGVMPENFCTCKNILLRDNNGNVFLVVVPHEKKINIKEFRRQLKEVFNSCGKLQFVPEEEMKDLLKVGSGNLSIFSLIFDENNKVTPILDEDLPKDTLMAFHPNYNKMSLFISHSPDKSEDDLDFFLRSIGKQPISLKIPGEMRANNEGIYLGKIL